MPFTKRGANLTVTLLASLLVITLITGCSNPSSDAEEEAAQPSSTPPSAEAPNDSDKQEGAAPSGQTRGGDGSEITLNALTEESSDAAQGVVKVAGYVERVSAPGGFNGITESPTFNGKGKTVHIEVTGDPSEGGESPPRPAMLTYDRADGAQRDWQGEWRCGP